MIASLMRRWRAGRDRRRMLRWWRRLTPGEQLGTFMNLFAEDRKLRQQFRRAIGVSGAEDAATPKRR